MTVLAGWMCCASGLALGIYVYYLLAMDYRLALADKADPAAVLPLWHPRVWLAGFIWLMFAARWEKRPITSRDYRPPWLWQIARFMLGQQIAGSLFFYGLSI